MAKNVIIQLDSSDTTANVEWINLYKYSNNRYNGYNNRCMKNNYQ
jgi:hypothetical protein